MGRAKIRTCKKGGRMGREKGRIGDEEEERQISDNGHTDTSSHRQQKRASKNMKVRISTHPNKVCWGSIPAHLVGLQ